MYTSDQCIMHNYWRSFIGNGQNLQFLFFTLKNLLVVSNDHPIFFDVRVVGTSPKIGSSLPKMVTKIRFCFVFLFFWKVNVYSTVYIIQYCQRYTVLPNLQIYFFFTKIFCTVSHMQLTTPIFLLQKKKLCHRKKNWNPRRNIYKRTEPDFQFWI